MGVTLEVGTTAAMVAPYPSLEQHFAPGSPKRILCLDGGGIRGILSLGFLLEIETLLRSRHNNDPDFRLCDYFDLIAGTSTGSIIAALLAQGRSVAEIITLYKELAGKVFQRRWWDPRVGALRARYRPQDLANFLRDILGADCCIGDQQKLRTGLLVMCKRIDSGSPWPISNNPKGRYYNARPGTATIANRDYKLWQIVRASTAAPTFFQPEKITIASPGKGEQKPLIGNFIDGGVSPHNNPSLQAYWLATLQGYGLQWPTGKDRMLIVSVGTGRTPVSRKPGWVSLVQGITALQSLMDDCGAVVESLMQGMGHCLHEPRRIDPEMSTLSPHGLAAQPRYSYVRYDVKLYHDPSARDGVNDELYLQQLALDEKDLEAMQKMDNPTPKELLLKLGHTAAQTKVRPEHFPREFDLVRSPQQPLLASDKRCYSIRKGKEVTAIRLNLDLDSFTYRKWGGLQTGKQGDWLVERDGQVHTVAAATFERTYKKVGPATYIKHTRVWAAPAAQDGVISTLEGDTHYRQGDYIVWNDEAGQDGYAINKQKFEELYRCTDDPGEESSVAQTREP
jgi:hypothetical protein